MKASVVIPTLGRANALEKCVAAFLSQTYKNFEIVLVTDRAETITPFITRYSSLSIRVVEQDEKGLTAARNKGYQSATGEIVSFIDDDVAVSSEWLEHIIDIFKRYPLVGGVTGPTIIPEELLAKRDILSFHHKTRHSVFWRGIGKIYTYFVLDNQPDTIGKIFKSGAFSLGSNYPSACAVPEPFEVDYLEACNMTFRKDILDATGCFSKAYKGLGEWSEPDLAFRVRKAGHRLLFHPKVIVYHCISQEGVYQQRGKDSDQRMQNFFFFYNRWIRLDTPEKICKVGINIFFINCYWLYKFFQTRSIYWLGGIWGTLKSLGRILFFCGQAVS